jgi:hypothetical protein
MQSVGRFSGWRRRLLPVTLIVICIIVLIGCIPIPASRELQPDGTPRPEHLVGTGASDKIQLGKTTLAEAFIAISLSTHKDYDTGSFFGQAMNRGHSSQIESMGHWFASSDGRHFTCEFEIRTTTWIYPLCFFAVADVEQRYLTLDINERGVVTATHSSANPPHDPPLLASRCLTLFDSATRGKLQAAGVLLDDDVLRRLAANEQDRESRFHR